MKRDFIGSHLVYATLGDRQMNNAIEVRDAEQFVKGESSRDLQVSLDARDLAILVYGNDRDCERLLSLSRDH